MEPLAPDSLPPLDSEFELGERLGNGAMGSVYRARELSSGRDVALKILHAQTAAAASRFVREGQVTAGLQHPGVVRVHSIGTYGGRPCLAYELVARARSFEEAIEDEPASSLDLLLQAGRALGAAHALGLTHRDVKSENLLVDASGRLRVTDFGLVTGEELARLTQSGAWVGTPLTMAPEQFGSRRRIGPATDVWALGVLLYRALAGVYPFLADSMLGIASAITSGHFERPSRVRPTPAPLEAVCLRALSLLPEDRYADGAAFASALEAAIGAGEGQRSRLPLALALLALALLAAASLAAATGTDPPVETGAAETPTPSEPHPPASPPKGEQAPAAEPDPERELLAQARAWTFQDSGPLPPEVLASLKPAGPGFNRNLESLRDGYGATTQVRTARALLGGVDVPRDPEAALRILRHTANGNRTAQALLLETLAREGKRKEELLWLARFAIGMTKPLEVNRLWQVSRDPSDSRAELSKKIWRAIPPDQLRICLLDYLEGHSSHPTSAPRAEGVELREFVIDSALLAWSQDPSAASDWDLGAILDRLSDPSRLRLVQRGSPSRRLATLCLRREGQLGERLRPEDLALLEAALAPTLAEGDEAWLLSVVKALSATNTRPPCLSEFLARLGSMPGAEAQRWAALCRARGFGAVASPAALETLQGRQRQGDHEAGVLLHSLLGERATPGARLQLLGPGVQAGHPSSMFALAASSLQRIGLQAPEGARQLQLLQRAAQAGNSDAQALLGRILDTTISEPQQMQQAYFWTRRAAEADHVESLRRLAVLQEAGFGCQPDREAALQSLRRAALLGHAPAALALGQRLLPPPPGETPRESNRRHREARRYLLRAKLQGLTQAASVAMVRHDLGHPHYKKRGYRELQELVKQGPNRSAQIELGTQLIARGEAERGAELLRKLAPTSTTALNVYLRHLREEGRNQEAEAFLRAGVKSEIPHYLIAAGDESFQADPKAGEALLQRAAKLGRPQALVILGQRLWETEGPEARRRAWQLWLRAHRAGNTSATRKLGAHEWPN